MVPTKPLVLSFLTVLLSVSGVLPHAETLTWEQCVAETAKNNLDLKKARETLDQARFSWNTSLGQFLPRISVSAGANKSGPYQVPDTFTGGDALSNSLGLSASETLFNGFGRLTALDKAGAQVRSAEAGLIDARAQAGYELTHAFVQLLYAQLQIDLLKDIADRRGRNEDLVKLRFQGGSENKGSWLQSAANHRQAETDLLRARRSLVLAAKTLAKVIGRTPAAGLSAQGTLAAEKPEAADDFILLALRTPAHARARAQLDSARASVLQSRGVFLPSLSASASLSRQGQDWTYRNGTWSAGLNLSFNLFNGGSDLWGLLSADSQVRAAEADLRNTNEETALSLESAYHALLSAAEQVEIQKDFSEAAQVRAEIARAQYNNGLLTFVNWDQVENDLVSSQKQTLATLRDAALSKASWDRSCGKGPLP